MRWLAEKTFVPSVRLTSGAVSIAVSTMWILTTSAGNHRRREFSIKIGAITASTSPSMTAVLQGNQEKQTTWLAKNSKIFLKNSNFSYMAINLKNMIHKKYKKLVEEYERG